MVNFLYTITNVHTDKRQATKCRGLYTITNVHTDPRHTTKCRGLYPITNVHTDPRHARKCRGINKNCERVTQFLFIKIFLYSDQQHLKHMLQQICSLEIVLSYSYQYKQQLKIPLYIISK